MKGRFGFPFAIALAACALPAPTSARTLPADVAAFVQRRDACDHFRGEEPYDAARAAELRTKLAQTCKGTDKQLAALRRKYAANRRVMSRLSRYEDRIE
jgi:hypothetical protein